MANRNTYDHLLLLKDAGAVSADGAGTVATVARVLDMGAADFMAKAVVDSSALDTTSTDETYRVLIQGSNVAAMSSGVVTLGATDVTVNGRSEVYFSNRSGDTVYRYVRIFFDVGGTTPSINATAFLAKV